MQPGLLDTTETFMGLFSRPEAGWEPRLLPETGFLPFDVPVFHPPVFTRELQPQVQRECDTSEHQMINALTQS